MITNKTRVSLEMMTRSELELVAFIQAQNVCTEGFALSISNGLADTDEVNTWAGLHILHSAVLLGMVLNPAPTTPHPSPPPPPKPPHVPYPVVDWEPSGWELWLSHIQIELYLTAPIVFVPSPRTPQTAPGSSPLNISRLFILYRYSMSVHGSISWQVLPAMPVSTSQHPGHSLHTAAPSCMQLYEMWESFSRVVLYPPFLGGLAAKATGLLGYHSSLTQVAIAVTRHWLFNPSLNYTSIQYILFRTSSVHHLLPWKIHPLPPSPFCISLALSVFCLSLSLSLNTCHEYPYGFHPFLSTVDGQSRGQPTRSRKRQCSAPLVYSIDQLRNAFTSGAHLFLLYQYWWLHVHGRDSRAFWPRMEPCSLIER